MSGVILLPYDRSAAAHVTATRAVEMARREGGRIVVAVPGLGGEMLHDALTAVRALAGEDVRVDGQLVGVSGAGDRFVALIDELEPSAVMFPLSVDASHRTLKAMVVAALCHPYRCRIVIDTRGLEVTHRAAGIDGEVIDERPRVAAGGRGVLRRFARQCVGVGAALKGVARWRWSMRSG